jgi:hypothetical protein
LKKSVLDDGEEIHPFFNATLVSWLLAAISPVTALRATRMWLSETNCGALLDL